MSVNARVELKEIPYLSDDEKFRILLHEFKLRVQKSGMMTEFKKHQFYESKSRIARRKKVEQIRARQGVKTARVSGKKNLD